MHVINRLIGPAIVFVILGLWFITRWQEPSSGEHRQGLGANGGVLVALADGRCHCEAILQDDGRMLLHTLGPQETQVIDVPAQSLTAQVTIGDAAAAPLEFVPDRQSGDAPGRTSRFVAQLPDNYRQRPLHVAIDQFRIGGQRYRVRFAWDAPSHAPAMPKPLANEAERELYLEPAGKYTAEDIEANGPELPSEKYRDFRAQHDFAPRSGDALCPISRTKANAECTWIINGHRFEFCCPPCIDELVALAKEDPAALQEPAAYIAE